MLSDYLNDDSFHLLSNEDHEEDFKLSMSILEDESPLFKAHNLPFFSKNCKVFKIEGLHTFEDCSVIQEYLENKNADDDLGFEETVGVIMESHQNED